MTCANSSLQKSQLLLSLYNYYLVSLLAAKIQTNQHLIVNNFFFFNASALLTFFLLPPLPFPNIKKQTPWIPSSSSLCSCPGLCTKRRLWKDSKCTSLLHLGSLNEYVDCLGPAWATYGKSDTVTLSAGVLAFSFFVALFPPPSFLFSPAPAERKVCPQSL